MNNHQQTLSRIIEILNRGKSGVIIIPQNPAPDAVAASTSLYLALNKIGKNISLVCSTKQDLDLIGVDKFQQTLTVSGDNLMISFPYKEGSIDKVDYNIQGDYFNLIITPRPGYEKLNPSQVKYSYTGGNLDFIIVIDSPTLNSLGEIYQENQAQFTGRDIINIDRHLTNGYFGTVNLVNKTISSISELILKIIETLNIEIDKDIATNLYAGIAASTNNFTSYSTNANTFENIAKLLKMGAIKKTIKKPVVQSPTISQSFEEQSFPSKPVFQKPIKILPSSESEPTPIEHVEKEKQPSQQGFEQNNPQNSLKPRIFQGGGLI